MAVSFQSSGLAWIASMIFFEKPSNRSSFDDEGCPSTKPLGLTIENAGSQPFAMSSYRSIVSAMFVSRTAGFVMIDVEYWKGLQMLQYSSSGFVSSGSTTKRFHW